MPSSRHAVHAKISAHIMPTAYNAAHAKVHISSCHDAHARSFLSLMPSAKIHGCSCQSSCLFMSCQFMRFFMPAHVMSLMPAPVSNEEQARATHATSFAHARSCHATFMPIFCFPDAAHAARRSAHVRVMPSPLSSFQLMPSSRNAS